MNKPAVELRKVSHSKSLSEETPAYTAQVWVDGKHFCDVSNHGQGGSDMQCPPKGQTNFAFNPAMVALDERIAATFPVRTYGDLMDKETGKPMEFRDNLESVCHQLVDDISVAKDLQRLLKRTVVYFDPAKKAIMSFKGKPVGVQRAHMITETIRKNPDAKVLNNLPFDEALSIYKEAGR